MDDIDRAQLQEALARQQAETFRQANRAPALPVTGQCYWCGDGTPGRLFCSLDCRDDWDAHLKRLRQSGQSVG